MCLLECFTTESEKKALTFHVCVKSEVMFCDFSHFCVYGMNKCVLSRFFATENEEIILSFRVFIKSEVMCGFFMLKVRLCCGFLKFFVCM